ncbi:TonB-dependent receptor [Echinicola sp. CAU 1574]|uniref:TonB-dependent receptor n=1 Tax=Echinicola arenosa TaxID=2774144 RepID=A0ABR9AJJ7_9BACT|nr:TonB-dependent receptor [Echinicola arenosa]MBD8488926.1 TonB-dependent receptor [Echinicola arenosa]
MKRKLLVLWLYIAVVSTTYAKNGSIKGIVKTSDGFPAEFVNILLKGTSSGTVTNKAGEYVFDEVKPGTYTLLVSFIGMNSQSTRIMVKSGEMTTVPTITLEENANQLNEIVISDKRDINAGTSDYVSKMPLRNLENPQVYNTVSADLLKQQAITGFDDALKNVPGIYKLWESTGRGSGDGSSYYSLRGFEAQATMVNGLPGLTNGSLDPANIERIEVIKGPSSTLFGSSLISYGGLINTITKKPYEGFGGEINYLAGSFGLNRVTADINAPISEGMNMRINTAYHTENSFQDAGFKKSVFVAPSFSYQANDRLSFLVNTEFLQEEKTNQTMLFLGRNVPLQFNNLEALNYNNKLSLTSNDLSMKNPRFILQGQMNYKLSNQWTSQTVISRGISKSDGYYSYLYDNQNGNGDFSLYTSKQLAQTNTSDIQQNFIGDFKLGNYRNRLVLGMDYYTRNLIDNSTGYAWIHNVTPQGEINYVNYAGETVAPRYLTRPSVDNVLASSSRNNTNTQNDQFSVYASDVINLTPQLIAMASLRFDYFNSRGDITSDEDDFDQTAFSPKFGLIYQPIKDKISVFANYMNGFQNVAPRQVADADGNNPSVKAFEPEHANQFEAGLKTNLFTEKLNATISYYDIIVDNLVTADPNNINNSLQGGKMQSRGIEFDIQAKPVKGLSLIAGYSYNDSEVLEGDESNLWLQEGRRPTQAGPKYLFNAWATYTLTQGIAKGLGFSFGGNYNSELAIMDNPVTGEFMLPSYTILNAAVNYGTPKFRIAININNVTDKEYYTGYSTINPQKPRNVVASFTYAF